MKTKPITQRRSLRSRSLVLAAALATAVLAASPVAARTMPKEDIQQLVYDEAVRNGTVPTSLALAVARAESNFDDEAVSHAGAIGVMQIMPATGRGEFGLTEKQLFDARTNVWAGVTYLERLYRQYGERWMLALSHYNGGTLRGGSGPDAVPHSYTRDYVRKVLAYKADYDRSTLLASLRARSASTLAMASAVDRTRVEPTLRERPSVAVDPLRLASAGEHLTMSGETGVGRDWRSYLGVSRFWRDVAAGEVAMPSLSGEPESQTEAQMEDRSSGGDGSAEAGWGTGFDARRSAGEWRPWLGEGTDRRIRGGSDPLSASGALRQRIADGRSRFRQALNAVGHSRSYLN